MITPVRDHLSFSGQTAADHRLGNPSEDQVSREVVTETFIKATTDEVWEALTNARELTRWFPIDARVEPGLGGSIWISWGEGASGQAPITAWEPGRRFGWTETRGPIKLAIDFHIEAREGGTGVRLVQSGFGDGPEWDDEFHMVTGGWAYFITNLTWYLEHHSGVSRDVVGLRDKVNLSVADTFSRLVALTEDLDAVRFLHSPATGQAGFTIASLNHAILFIEIEPGKDSCRGGFWLSTYGLGDQFEGIKTRFTDAYRLALDISGEK
jgi:uncharacterized protein YndB with AHSA1/START domain